MPAPVPEMKMPTTAGDERDTLLDFLDWKRAVAIHTADDLTDEQARWTPDGKLLPIAGIINHLAHVEARWIDGRYLQQKPPAANPEVEFASTRPIKDLVADYCDRIARSNEVIRGAPSLDEPCPGGASPIEGLNLRWVLFHLLEETAQHAGHAESTREMLDGRKSGT